MQNSENRFREENFIRLLSANYIRIKSFIFCQLPNESDVEDVMQETSVTLWNKFEDYQSGTDFVAWAVTIAKYKVMEFRRRNRHNPFLLDDDVLELLNGENPSNFDNTEERTQALASCVKKLPRSDQEFIKLKYSDGFTLKKLAHRFGLSIATAYRNLARIHGLLIECVRREIGVGA